MTHFTIFFEINNSNARRLQQYFFIFITDIKFKNFEENFEESSANFSESNYGGGSPHDNDNSDSDPGQPMQLLSILPNGKVQLND